MNKKPLKDLKQRINVMLDRATIDALKNLSLSMGNKTNISKAIRFLMAQHLEKNNDNNNNNNTDRN